MNAAQFPGPALWQAIMLVVAIVWGVAFWFLVAQRNPPVSTRTFVVSMTASLALVFAIGIALMVWILNR